jgi:GntR family transcriptional regulator
MEFPFAISAGTASPIFKQIVDQVRLAVVSGRLVAGMQLPSARALAERLLVNPNTIARAYGELSREGIIDTQQGRGVFIAEPRQIYTNAERARRIEPLVEALANEGIALGFAPDELLESLRRRLARMDAPASQRRKGS